MNDLIPRKPKRKRQPTAEMMRQQLRLAADEIIRLRGAMHPMYHSGGVVQTFVIEPPHRMTRIQAERFAERVGRNPPPPTGPKPAPPPNPPERRSWLSRIFRKPK